MLLSCVLTVAGGKATASLARLADEALCGDEITSVGDAWTRSATNGYLCAS